MLFIKQLLSSSGLLDSKKADCSIACISTSRPIYLAFDQKSDYPMYVVRKIDGAPALKSHNIHTQIYKHAGILVPQPLGLYTYAGEEYDIQHGVRGLPWFQLKSRLRSEEERTQLESRIWETLKSFQAAISQTEINKSSNLKPHEELRNAYEGYQKAGENLNSSFQAIVEKAIIELSQEPGSPAVPQHGDFCLNNLIIDSDHITVIDFEDFGITSMPLYDHFTLALSLPSSPTDPVNSADIFTTPPIIAAGQVFGISKDVVCWHFLHHLLLRLGPWSTGEKRKPYRAWLKKVLNCFLTEQDK
ncbi:aminoglycoside phosphotransferase family protein [Marinobacter sp. F3R11]|uniref:aminoglycoside phosphotransferase family protein n=1 Tax=Marinobacter sp. F3R11 TaxID=2267231 RepID=UPI000DEB69AA|nr:aminoglycoside phosphotransferase family protein [Marinobacter sp. F3R11]RBW49724.1 hypothetical protein DS878_05110 [Marinobacter sp. F3R11]